ncbi:lipase family protein [Synechococcus sp. J7-Johnson]|uniref:lipase family protein n=1 Tax=Synechococcus sp. J7-Johnson TaxID=2823737 RepID=UPI0020CFE692|nr:lipase family protein [Synechococcus sp. J7-Johnson]MCP9841175.1 lipase family protein [Synechococcus sp. J7-Johnson]
MDPYYEQLHRSQQDMREFFMSTLRANLKNFFNDAQRGPEELGGLATSNPKLDPIITEYQRLYPWNHSVVAPEPGDWNYLKPSLEIVKHVKEIRMCSRLNLNQLEVIATKPHNDGDNPRDVLYCFEGATGIVEKERPIGNSSMTLPAWSLMGFVLLKYNSPQDINDYDVHITFRGSRSGNGTRAAKGGWMENGNADWVTDCDSAISMTKCPEISPTGKVPFGFKNSLISTLPMIWKCLEAIARDHVDNPPKTIYFTGHSLGGALAALCAVSMRHGEGEIALRNKYKVNNWPWNTSVELITYGSPTIGTEDLVDGAKFKLKADRVYIHGDPIATVLRAKHIGTELKLAGNLPFKIFDFVRHEPYLIREELVKVLGLQALNRPIPEAPWIKYRSFSDLLASNDWHTFLEVNGNRKKLPDFLKYLKLYLYALGVSTNKHKPNRVAEQHLEDLINDFNNEEVQWDKIKASSRGFWDDLDFERFMLTCYLLLRYSQNQQAGPKRQALDDLAKKQKVFLGPG